MTALGMALEKQLGSKTYLQNLKGVVDMLSAPGKSAVRFFGTMAGGMVPFSAAPRQGNSDPYMMREARHFTDFLLRGIPGFSEDLPARYDAFGEPVHVHRGLSVNTPTMYITSKATALGWMFLFALTIGLYRFRYFLS
jgi:hypothetical protein